MNFLEGSKRGAISEVLELPTEFVVIEVLEVTQKGYRPLEEVRTQVENLVKAEKRKELTAQKVEGFISGNSGLEGISSASGNEIQDNENLRAGATVIPGVGREPQVIGAIFGMKAGETSGVVEGNNAAFVIHVISLNEANMDNLAENQKETIRQRLAQQKVQMFSSIWLEQL